MRLSRIAALTALVLGVTLAQPTSAYASSVTRSVTLPVSHGVNNYGEEYISTELGAPWQVGDCVLSGHTWTYRPDAGGRAQFGFNYSVYTNHTRNYDVWHARFRFKTSFGSTVLEVGPFDLGKMYNGAAPIEDIIARDVVLDPRLFDLISDVEWVGEC
jgi:hypothetical protein